MAKHLAFIGDRFALCGTDLTKPGKVRTADVAEATCRECIDEHNIMIVSDEVLHDAGITPETHP